MRCYYQVTVIVNGIRGKEGAYIFIYIFFVVEFLNMENSM